MTAPPANILRLYGIKNCDSMKKAFAWLDERAIPYEFHDYKKSGVPHAQLLSWCKALGWKALLNTKGATWRKLTPEQQDITTQSKAIALMEAQPSVIRRPVIESANGPLLVGFDPTRFESFIQ